jgi:NNP family nitrate/nitrite transporter-like MFS transporter
MPTNLEKWDVENQDFWESTGKTIANKNLWLSIPALFLSFATWAMWGVIINYMKDFGYNFGMTKGLLSGSEEYKTVLKEVNTLYYSLPAIAGLAGATLRIPNSFLISLGGGRNVIFFSALLMLIPAIGTGWALSDINTTYYMFASMALLSGFGGGNFASSMSNISFFFPKRVQGYALGMNAGIGNLGVGAMQKIIPLVIGLSLFGAIGSEAIVKGVPFDGLQNAGWVWVPLLILSVIGAFFGMNNVVTGTPSLPGTIQGVSKTAYMIALGLISAVIGAFLLIGLPWDSWGLKNGSIWIVVFVVAFITVLLMKYATPGEIRGNLNKQFEIFKNKHNWVMTIIYTMTFGSFIGFSLHFLSCVKTYLSTLTLQIRIISIRMLRTLCCGFSSDR